MQPSSRGPTETDVLINRVRQAGKTVRFRKREVIFLAAERSDSLYFLESGIAKLTLTSLHGKEAVISILHAGDFFGETALNIGEAPRSTNAIALTDVQATRIGREPMLRLLHSQPDARDAFISCLISVITRLKEDVAGQLLYGSEQRLARALLSVAQLRENESIRVLPGMSQQELANMIGITRQGVNSLLKRFKKLGLVDTAGGLRVHSSIRHAARES